jgi:hypothetical protein
MSSAVESRPPKTDNGGFAPLNGSLIEAANRPTRELSLEEVRKNGLLAVLRKQAGKKSIKSFDC